MYSTGSFFHCCDRYVYSTGHSNGKSYLLNTFTHESSEVDVVPVSLIDWQHLAVRKNDRTAVFDTRKMKLVCDYAYEEVNDFTDESELGSLYRYKVKGK